MHFYLNSFFIVYYVSMIICIFASYHLLRWYINWIWKYENKEKSANKQCVLIA